MNKTPKNESGFSIAELLLIIVILGIIGFAGWFVYNSHKKNTASRANNNISNTSNKNKLGTTPSSTYADWKTYNWSAEGLTFQYPSSWLTTNPQEVAKGQTATKPGDPEAFISSPTVVTESGFAAGSNPPTSNFTGAFAVDATKDTTENIETSSDAGSPHGIAPFVYILKVIPINVPGYKQMWIIEEGEQSNSYADELALTDKPVKVGLTNSSADDSFQSKSNPNERISFTVGLFSQQQNDQTFSFINMPVNKFDRLQDYNNALNIIKSIRY